jgi:hypothetical protein
VSSPTQRSLALMRERGFHAETVERWIPGANIRRDLWGFVDILCLGMDGELVGVQTTSASNLAARITKIAESPLIDRIRKAGIKLVAHGWGKKKGRWQVREVDVS